MLLLGLVGFSSSKDYDTTLGDMEVAPVFLLVVTEGRVFLLGWGLELSSVELRHCTLRVCFTLYMVPVLWTWSVHEFHELGRVDMGATLPPSACFWVY